MQAIDKRGLKIGPIWLTPEVSYLHFSAFMYASLVTIGLLTFVNIGQALILSRIDTDGSIGTEGGILTFAGELTIMFSVFLFGILCDRIGRSPVYALGLVLMGVSYVLMPFATSVAMLIAFRVIYAGGVAAATGMLGTVTNDYPQEISRGRMVALSGMVIGFGAVLFNGGFRALLGIFEAQGMDEQVISQTVHWIAAGVCFVSAVLVGLGLKPGTPTAERTSVIELIKVGFTEAKKPRTALAYATAFVARSDLVIIGTFTALWGAQAGIDRGLSPSEGVGRGVTLFITAQLAGLLWSPVMGWAIDRFNRVSVQAFGAVLSSIAFLSMLFVGDIFDNANLPLFVLLGIGQISIFFASQALIGQEAPAEKRGTVIGAFGKWGALGILFFSLTGGYLFDEWRPAGAFFGVGIASAIIAVLAVIVRVKWPGYTPGDPVQAPVAAPGSASQTLETPRPDGVQPELNKKASSATNEAH